MPACSFCGRDLEAYDTVVVTRDHGIEREDVGRFCTFACLDQYIDREDLVYGEACQC